MRKNKLILFAFIVFLLAMSCYRYNTRIEVENDFIISSQELPKSQLAENIHLKVTMVRTLRENTY